MLADGSCCCESFPDSIDNTAIECKYQNAPQQRTGTTRWMRRVHDPILLRYKSGISFHAASHPRYERVICPNFLTWMEPSLATRAGVKDGESSKQLIPDAYRRIRRIAAGSTSY